MNTKRNQALTADRRSRALAILFATEGFLYLGYLVWQAIVSPLDIYRIELVAGVLFYAFFAVLLFTGAYFVYRAYTLFAGRVSLDKVRLSTSVYALLLWVMPAFVSMQVSSTLLASPETDGLHPYGFYLQRIGFLFVAIGAINISSIVVLALRGRFKGKQPLQPTTLRLS